MAKKAPAQLERKIAEALSKRKKPKLETLAGRPGVSGGRRADDKTP
jgi:hypothetical protein